ISLSPIVLAPCALNNKVVGLTNKVTYLRFLSGALLIRFSPSTNERDRARRALNVRLRLQSPSSSTLKRLADSRRLRRRPTQLRPLTANTRHHTSSRNLSGTRQPSLRVHTQYLLPSLQLRQLIVNLVVYLINSQNGLIGCFVQRSLSLPRQILCIQRFEKLKVRCDLVKALLSRSNESLILSDSPNRLSRQGVSTGNPVLSGFGGRRL